MKLIMTAVLVTACVAVTLDTVASGAEVTLVPVGASVPYTIVDNEIILSEAGGSVELEFHISGWGPNELQAYIIGVDPSGYAGGWTGSLSIADPATDLFIDHGFLSLIRVVLRR